ncbi:MAG: DUF4124 domain-containing protein [Methylococcaceae bacterium]|nr:MAG: DUF4124 domain-containing protein [Methylococcaceae bacterium]
MAENHVLIAPIDVGYAVRTVRGHRTVRTAYPTRLLGILLLTLAAQVEADVYRWQDESGRVHYGDQPAPGAQSVKTTADAVYRKVRSVHDGDTLTLDDSRKVRLLGINTPEIDSAGSVAEAGGEAAKNWLKARIEGHSIRLEQDVEAQDHYGRTLAHLYAEDGEHLNLELVRRGLAVASVFPPNLKHAEELAAAQRQARQNKLGIWGDPAYAPQPITGLAQQPGRGWRRWVGTPTALDYGRTHARLIFSDTVAVDIPKENLALFPPLKSLLGQRLEIRGWASRRKQNYTVLIRHPSALEALD